jgi:hypothetical protein
LDGPGISISPRYVRKPGTLAIRRLPSLRAPCGRSAYVAGDRCKSLATDQDDASADRASMLNSRRQPVTSSVRRSVQTPSPSGHPFRPAVGERFAAYDVIFAKRPGSVGRLRRTRAQPWPWIRGRTPARWSSNVNPDLG